MTRTDYLAAADAVTAAGEAELWGQAAEDAIDSAVEIAGTQPTASENALVGIGLALRATNARIEAPTDEVINLADVLAASQAAPRLVRRPWWRRLAYRCSFTGRERGETAQACPHCAAHGNAQDDVEDAAPGTEPGDVQGGASVTRLHTSGVRS
ncbi:hypothetical protein ACLQ2P_41565 [Actinomadura citrea]|uniref:hypothetical protein n=1 Tax=Actinomadura citrea TaxID=46158 RepID=UPI003CE523EF